MRRDCLSTNSAAANNPRLRDILASKHAIRVGAPVRHVCVVVILLLAAAGVSHQAYGASAYVQFESSSNLLDFSLHPTSGNTRPIQWSAAGGVGNSGSLKVDWIHETTYTAQSFQMTDVGDQINLSTWFHAGVLEPVGAGFTESHGEVYLTKEPNGFPFDNDAAFVEIRRSSTAESISGGPLQAGGGSFPGFSVNYPIGTLQSERWYELNVAYENLGGNQIDWDILVRDRGSDGLQSPVTVMSAQRQTADTRGFLTDPTLYAGFTAVGFGNVTAIDNFSATDEAPGNPQQLSLEPTFDVLVTPGSVFSLTEGGASIRVGGNTGSTTTPVTEALMEFPLSQLPIGVVIESAKLVLDPSVEAGDPHLRVFGYNGDGLASTVDAKTVGAVLQSDYAVDIVNGVEILLDADVVQTLIADSSHLGLRIASLNPNNYLTFHALETVSSFLDAPTLVLEFSTTVLAGDYNEDGSVDAADYTVWRDSLGATGSGLAADGSGDNTVDEDDYQLWKDHYGESTASGSAAASANAPVPEPATLSNFLIGLSLLVARRRA